MHSLASEHSYFFKKSNVVEEFLQISIKIGESQDPQWKKKIGLRHVKYKKRQNAFKKFRQIETAGRPQLREVLFFKMLNDNGCVNPFQVKGKYLLV